LNNKKNISATRCQKRAAYYVDSFRISIGIKDSDMNFNISSSYYLPKNTFCLSGQHKGNPKSVNYDVFFMFILEEPFTLHTRPQPSWKYYKMAEVFL